ncbi:MAG: hypothetical protein ACI4F7_00730 [Acutalibacteraceae bacterium]
MEQEENMYLPQESNVIDQNEAAGNVSANMVNNIYSEGRGGLKFVLNSINIGETVTLDTEVDGIYIETPPIPIKYSGKASHILSTGRADLLTLKNDKSFSEDKDAYDLSSHMVLTYPPMYKPENANDYLTWDTDPDHRYLWNRVYYGIMGALVLKNPKDGKDYIVAFTHGENKNGTFGPDSHIRYITNTVEPWGKYSQPEDKTFPRPEPYEFDRVYYGAIGMAVCPADESNGKDLMKNDFGPIVWPSAGYIDNAGNQICYGPRHPYAITDGAYVYLYYIDDIMTANFPKPQSVDSGRMFGLKCARATVEDCFKGKFSMYYNGEFNEPALPENFDRFDRSYVYKNGGRGDIILAHPSGSPIVRFACARLKGTDAYLGISYDRLKNRFLWISKNLADFTRVCELGPSELMYPQLYNKDFTSISEIDAEEFYIAGSDCSTEPPKISCIKMSIDIEIL